MREILFRGKRVDNGEWVEGYYYHNKVMVDDTKNHDYIMGKTNGVYFEHWCISKTISEFTGLTDKNGKRIFEGDICRFREWSKGDMCWVGKVHYEHQQFVISGDRNKECETPFTLVMSRFIPKNIEVIGNIHDNKLEDFENGC